MPELTIRRATPEDASLISLVAHVSFKEAFKKDFQYADDLFAYQQHTFNVAKIRSSLRKSNNYFWIALVDELAVGYAKMKFPSASSFLEESPLAQLQKIYVLEDFLGQRIGRQLQDEVIRQSKELNAQGLWLSVYQGNTHATGFYEYHGFDKIGEHRFKIGRVDFDFWAMRKKL